MAPIVIYGPAVQEARNRLRSAQISTMFEVLRVSLFKEQDTDAGSSFARGIANLVNSLQPPQGNAKAAAALSAAKTRINQFLNAGNVEDVFALADALRWLGEYIELGGGNEAIQKFRVGLHNPAAFSPANRARRPVPDYSLEELPDLGIFKNRLLDRSVMKYMERFYGPYIGADVSGTTTDSMAVLAYLLEIKRQEEINKDNLQGSVRDILTEGQQMIPIASMVLQYHHSLMETGVALARTSPAMSPGTAPENSVLPSFYLYDLTSLSAGNTGKPITDELVAGNTVLVDELKGLGLIVLRDQIDIEHNDYADTEIALLVEDPKDADLFNAGLTYDAFSAQRVEQTLSTSFNYRRGDPSLAAMANEFRLWLELSEENIRELVQMNSIQLKEAGYFADLDAALATVQQDDAQQMQAEAPEARSFASGTALAALPVKADGKSKLTAAQPETSGSREETSSILQRLNPQAIRALEKLLGAI